MRRTKKTRKRATKPKTVAVDHTVNSWSVKMAAAWAGIPERTLYRMLRESLVPTIPLGAAQTQQFQAARTGKRNRVCYRFVIPRVAFMRAWETLGAPVPATIGKTAA